MGYPVLTFEVGSSDSACGKSNLKLDAQPLDVQWEGAQGTGDGFLKAYAHARLSWTVTCLYNPTSAARSISYGEDVLQVISFRLPNAESRQSLPGFTISYRQTGQPSILRFEPSYTVPTKSDSDYDRWQNPLPPFIAEEPTPTELASSVPDASFGSSDSGQKSLKSHLSELKDKVKDKVHKVFESLSKLCHKKGSSVAKAGKSHQDGAKLTKNSTDPESSFAIAEENSDDVHLHDELDISPTAAQPSHVHAFSAAETRSIHPPASATNTSDTFPPIHHPISLSAVVLRSFFLALVLISFLIWLFLRCHDPRRRVDRAARREERKTKRLYRRAARRQRLKHWIWELRMKYGLVRTAVLRWNEKDTRTAAQEDVLEDVMKDDIRALRNAHRIVSSITGTSAATAAEEGHAGFGYDGDGQPQRRLRSSQSVLTLPGYESEASQPPPYAFDEARRASLAEFTSDSSVVSTSPRISRDGTSSDYEEKIEDISLGTVECVTMETNGLGTARA